MNAVIWFVLRTLGMALVVILLLDDTGKLGFVVAGLAQPWIILVALPIIAGLLYWALRVVWTPIRPVTGLSRWRHVTRGLGLIVALLFIVPAWQGGSDGITFNQQMHRLQAQARRMASLDATLNALDTPPDAILTDTAAQRASLAEQITAIQQQSMATTMAYQATSLVIDLGLVSVFLILVSVVRFAWVRRRASVEVCAQPTTAT